MENTGKIMEILFPGKSVQVEVRNPFGKKLIKKTTIRSLDHFNLFLNLPVQRDFFEQLTPYTNMALVCKHNEEQSDYVFFTKFIKVLGTNQPVAILGTPSGYKKGRQAVRFDVAVPFSYFVNEKEIKDGMVNNLSMNGLLATIKPDMGLHENDHLTFKLILPNSAYPLLLTGKITRIVRQDTKYQIALHFPYIAFDIQDKIVKFLFSAQKTFAPKDPQPKTNILKNAPPYRKIG